MEKHNLSPGWAWATLKDIGPIVSGGTPKTSQQENFDGDISWITPADLTGYCAKTIAHGRRNISEKGLKSSSARLIPRRSVLFSSRAPIGYVAIAANDLATNQGFKSVVVSRQFDESYLYFYLKSAKRIAEQNASGTTFKEISKTRFAQLPIPVPPINEQHRIVEKTDRLFAELDQGEAALREVQVLLTRYRQSVLKAAVTGALTADWRADNADHLESGHDLLARILETRRKNWQGRGKYKEPVAPDTTDLPELPEAWVWASLDTLLQDGPTNGTSPKQVTAGKGVPSFKLTATTSGKFLINDATIKYVDADIDHGSKYWLRKGDVLIQRGNTIEYVGTAAIFPGPDDSYIYPDLMMRIRFADSKIARWVVTWINFEFARKHFRRLATGIAGNMPKINGSTLRSLAIPVPSRAEIDRILEEVTVLNDQYECTAHSCQSELARSKALRQSILKDAFAGKLVPQDPDDEPASELLARIRAERAAQSAKGRKKR